MNFLNKKIFGFRDVAFGIDISDTSVKVAESQEDGSDKVLVSFGLADIPAGSISEGNIVKMEEVADAVRRAISGAGPKKIKGNKVVCSLPESKAFLRIINIPKMKETEIQGAIKWEIEANIPLDIDQVYYDWKILDKNIHKGKDTSVLVVAVARSVVNQFIEVLEMNGLEVVGLEVESIAQARSLISEKEENKTTIIVDIGGRKTSFLALIGVTPCFTSSIAISGRSFTDAISKRLEISMEEADKVKIKYGIGSYTHQDPVFLSVEAVVKSLTSEMEKTIDFFINELGYSDSVDDIIICGGGANMKGLIPFVSKELQREVRLGDPWINFSQSEKVHIIERKNSVKYSTALGLSLRGLRQYEELS